ncbi:hypothetical protein JTE90_027851, partial [Oedothorax gibbosus]
CPSPEAKDAVQAAAEEEPRLHGVVKEPLCAVRGAAGQHHRRVHLVRAKYGPGVPGKVCQRLQLQQMQYFGLRFVSRRGPLWWVELGRPLKRQLDKYALDGGRSLVHLHVMFFVPDVNMLHDDVTRYHYFLQLKCDILEGKLCCNEEQTILFASYSLQAEFGDHDPERHTTEYLTNFGLLPKHLGGAKEREEAVLERVIQAHLGLQGMSQQMAEVCYIREAQGINGYGLECFAAKDSSNTAIIVGVSLAGIYIWYLNSQPSIYFSWDQILNLVHQKRCFGVEHRNGKKVLQIYMEDSLSAKYLWKTCIQQHGFYTKNEGLLNTPPEQTPPLELRPPSAPSSRAVSRNPSTVVKVEVRPKHTMQESQDSLDGLGVYHTDGRYSERIVSAKSCNHLLEKNSASNAPSRNTSSTCLSGSASQQHIATIHQHPSTSSGSDLSEIRRKSSSDVSLHRPSPVKEPPCSENSRPVCSVLPTYRQAPDYDTAIKLKYGLQSCSTGDVPNSHLATNNTSVQQLPQAQYRNYADLSHLDISEVGKGINPLVSHQVFVSAPSLHPPVQTLGCVEPNGAQVMYQFKPPPPYPYAQSSSTPDLSKNNQVVSSHPSVCPSLHPAHSLEPICAKIVTSNPIQHQTIASSQPVHSYENIAPGRDMYENRTSVTEDPFPPQSPPVEPPMGPMLVAAMNGLSVSRPTMFTPPEQPAQEARCPKDARIQALESHLMEGQVFLEFERIVKRNPNSTFTTALLPENSPRNRFKDVFPYEENRVRLTPTSENTTGYINASHMTVSMGGERRSYIAAQGPLPNTLYSFWQMIWEHQVKLIVMLTEVKAPVMTTPSEDVVSPYSGIYIWHLSRDGTKGCSYALTASPKLQHSTSAGNIKTTNKQKVRHEKLKKHILD